MASILPRNQAKRAAQRPNISNSLTQPTARSRRIKGTGEVNEGTMERPPGDVGAGDVVVGLVDVGLMC